MSNDHSDSSDTDAPAKIDIGEEVDEFASTITLNRQDVVGSLRVPSPDEGEVDEEASTVELSSGGRLAEVVAATKSAEPKKITPHLGQEVDPSEGTLTLDAAAIQAALAKDGE